MAQTTVNQLVESHADELELRWLAGRLGGDRKITPKTESESNSTKPSGYVDDLENNRSRRLLQAPFHKSLIGHLSLIHPNQIQLLGYTEVKYLRDLSDISRVEAFGRLMRLEPAMIIIADQEDPPERLLELCESSQTPLCASPQSSDKLISDLNYYLSNQLTKVINLHGVYMEIITIGVLLVGESGVGKSELAVELVTRGHRLIADDAPEFRRIAPDIVDGTCPKALSNFLEVRGLGIINVRELFGAGAVKMHKFLRLIVRLERFDSERMLSVDRLEGSYRTVNVLGLEIPEITLPVAPGRNLAVMVECATRNHILRLNGYNATEDFMQRQSQLMETPEE